jgi:hypothetical protein
VSASAPQPLRNLAGAHHPQALDRVNCAGTTTDNNHRLIRNRGCRLGLSLGDDSADLGLDLLLAGRDDDLAVFHLGRVLPQRVEAGRVFNVASADIEAG